MVHEDHVRLISKAVKKGPANWVDLGSGTGAFTLALRDLGGIEIKIYSVDKDKYSLDKQQKAFAEMFPQSNIHFLQQDFTDSLDLPKLDGILMANSLHYVEEHVAFLKTLRDYLKPGGKLVVVEYNVDQGNMWVPYPLSIETFGKKSEAAGFRNVNFLDSVPSQFLQEIYSAEAFH